MNNVLESVCSSLDDVSASVLAGWSGDQTFQEAWGWNCLPITRHDLAAIPRRLASRIRAASPADIGGLSATVLQDIPRRLHLLKSATVPNLYSGNNTVAVAVFVQTIGWVEAFLEPLLTWSVIDDPKKLPPSLARRITSYNSRLNQIDPDMEGLEDKVRRITDAHDTAESLPTDMEALRTARDGIGKLATNAQNLFEDIDSRDTESSRLLALIRDREDEASKLVDKCEEAYRITTTKGLAGAFDERANSLKDSMSYWVGGLILSLIAGAGIGSHRIEVLSAAASVADPQWGTVLVQIVLSLLSVGGPLWFAWIATKQVGQRFRLAEDYAFKASVAKAYEGYRKEAARIDEVFEARLFSSALSRLEEAPLRLIEGTTHGSPWHEFMSSPAFKQAVDTVPEFKDTITGIMTQGLGAVKDALGSFRSPKDVSFDGGGSGVRPEKS